MGGALRLELSMTALFALAIGCGDGAANTPGSASPAAETGANTTEPGSSSSGGPTNTPTATAGRAAPGSSQGGKAGSGSEPNKPVPGEAPPDEPLSGETEFVSADTQSGSRTGAGRELNAATGTAGATAAATPAAAPQASDAAGAASTSRAVERGDIYRVLGDKRILNLNSYRGVQLIDISDVSKPRIEGRLAVAGDPVELYVVGDRAIVLLNGWQGYYGSRDDVKVERQSGGLVMSVDISDRAHPTLLDQVAVPGYLATSRLTQGDGRAALYVAATNYDGQQKAIVKSFDVTGNELVAKSELDLGGYVQDVQATTDVLMVSSTDYTKTQGRSEVSVIDISNPDGTMVRGGTVLAAGIVQNKFNMDAYNGVLRVVSGSNWNGSLQNQLETFSLRNLQNLQPLDSCAFGRVDPQTGRPEQLYATLFVENRAFFVTYFRTDPFHAFEVADDGTCTEHNEFIVSGWNDFFRATLGNTRLIGVGHNDANDARKLSVSLYDAVDLTNAAPLRARADIDLPGGYSEATWDDRGFSVIEDAVTVQAPDGTAESGLVLLPFQGWDQKTGESVAQVQIFTFSSHTLTKRGTMDHGSPVRRSFNTEPGTTANLSEEQLSLFDTKDPAAPSERGRVDVAPNYSQVFVYGDHIARVRSQGNNYYVPLPAASTTQAQPKSTVQILSRTGDVDGSEVLATFEVPAAAQLIQVGKLLVSVETATTYDNTGTKPPTYESTLRVFDLSDPTKPTERGSLKTDRLEPYYGGGWAVPTASRPAIDCFDCGIYPPYRAIPQNFVVGDAIAFLHASSQQKSLGEVTQCYTSAPGGTCAVAPGGVTTCDPTYYSGGITCTTPKGGEESCSGEFYKCNQQGCQPSAPPPDAYRSCNTYEQFRYWTSYGFDTLDVRNPDAPSLAPRLDLPKDEEGTSVISVGSTLYVNHQKQHTLKNDPRSYVKHYVRLVDFADPQAPAQGAAVNVPGDIIAAYGDTLYSRDYVWKESNARTLVARLALDGNTAHLQASQLFEDRSVSAVELDGVGHVLVSSDEVPDNRLYPVAVSPASPLSPAPAEPKSRLSILDAMSLDTVGETDVDSWANFKDAQNGRALFQVSGGLLVFDVQDPAKPKAQAYFATAGWPNEVLFDGDTILFAAGSYGVYRYDAREFNLLMH